MSKLLADILVRAEDLIPGLEVVSDSVVRGGQPDAEGLRILHEAGVRTIVNLRHSIRASGPSSGSFFRRRGDDEEIDEERACAEGLGLHFVNISLDGISTPPRRDLERFVALFSEPANTPLFVHCLYGKERTSLMVGAYRVGIEGWPVDKAYQEMLRTGFDPLRTVLSDALFDFAGQSKT